MPSATVTRGRGGSGGERSIDTGPSWVTPKSGADTVPRSLPGLSLSGLSLSGLSLFGLSFVGLGFVGLGFVGLGFVGLWYPPSMGEPAASDSPE